MILRRFCNILNVSSSTWVFQRASRNISRISILPNSRESKRLANEINCYYLKFRLFSDITDKAPQDKLKEIIEKSIERDELVEQHIILRSQAKAITIYHPLKDIEAFIESIVNNSSHIHFLSEKDKYKILSELVKSTFRNCSGNVAFKSVQLAMNLGGFNPSKASVDYLVKILQGKIKQSEQSKSPNSFEFINIQAKEKLIKWMENMHSSERAKALKEKSKREGHILSSLQEASIADNLPEDAKEIAIVLKDSLQVINSKKGKNYYKSFYSEVRKIYAALITQLSKNPKDANSFPVINALRAYFIYLAIISDCSLLKEDIKLVNAGRLYDSKVFADLLSSVFWNFDAPVDSNILSSLDSLLDSMLHVVSSYESISDQRTIHLSLHLSALQYLQANRFGNDSPLRQGEHASAELDQSLVEYVSKIFQVVLDNKVVDNTSEQELETYSEAVMQTLNAVVKFHCYFNDSEYFKQSLALVNRVRDTLRLPVSFLTYATLLRHSTANLTGAELKDLESLAVRETRILRGYKAITTEECEVWKAQIIVHEKLQMNSERSFELLNKIRKFQSASKAYHEDKRYIITDLPLYGILIGSIVKSKVHGKLEQATDANPSRTAEWILTMMAEDGILISPESVSEVVKLFERTIHSALEDRESSKSETAETRRLIMDIDETIHSVHKFTEKCASIVDADYMSSFLYDESLVKAVVRVYCAADMLEEAQAFIYKSEDISGQRKSAAVYEPIVHHFAMVRQDTTAVDDLATMLISNGKTLTGKIVDSMVLVRLLNGQRGDALDAVQELYNQHQIKVSVRVMREVLRLARQRADKFEVKRVQDFAKYIYPQIDWLKDVDYPPFLSGQSATTVAVTSEKSIKEHDEEVSRRTAKKRQSTIASILDNLF